MIGKDGQVKVIDFGLSRQGKMHNLRTRVGTPYYMAPEVINGQYGPQCDIWSVGVILYLLFSGFYPFNGKNKAKLFQNILTRQVELRQKEF